MTGTLESILDHDQTVKHSLEMRNIKIKVKELPIPVAFAAAFEGEIIRKADMQVEFYSGNNTTCEAEQHQEQVDEVEVEGQRAEQSAAADGCGVVERGVFAEGADLLGVVSGH